MISYKYLKLDDVFDFNRGKRLTKAEQIDGEMPYISSTKFNNGVDNFINPPKSMTIYKNCITMANSGSLGSVFYHDYEFVASDHVTVFWLKDDKKLNNKIAFYMITCLKKLQDKYFFNREMSDSRLKNELIYLPINEDESVNYDFIEEKMAHLLLDVKWNSKPIEKNTQTHTLKKYKTFKLLEVFHVRSVSKKITKKQLINGVYLYITTSNKNQGFSGYHHEYAETGNVFTVDSATDGACFYQPDPFIGSDHVEILEIKKEHLEYITKYNVLYLQTVLNYYLEKYEFSRKRAQKRIKKEEISLPVDSDELIDWKGMDHYIRSLKYSKFI